MYPQTQLGEEWGQVVFPGEDPSPPTGHTKSCCPGGGGDRAFQVWARGKTMQVKDWEETVSGQGRAGSQRACGSREAVGWWLMGTWTWILSLNLPPNSAFHRSSTGGMFVDLK